MSVQDVRVRDEFGGITTPGNKTTLVDSTDASNVYIGKAQVGSKESEAKWQIKRISTSGSVVKMAFAGGSDDFVNTWSSRATYTYPTT